MKKLSFLRSCLRHILIASVILFLGVTGIMAQSPLPPPPSQAGAPFPPGNTPPPPAPFTQTPPPPMAPAPNPQTPPGWGAPGFLANPPAGDWMNQGTLNVMATGYDTESVLVQIPLVVSYTYNGVNYNVMVLNSWSPFTQTWNIGVDTPANQTSYYLNGFTYNYYVNLPSGTFYFNL